MRKDIERLLKLVPEMKKRFTDAPKRYRSLLRQAKSEVVRWEWCTDTRYSHNPLAPERSGGRCGRVLSKAPKKKAYKYRYGFSSDGHVVVEEQYCEFKGRKNEAFWEYSERRIDSTLFHHSPEKWVINVESTFFEDGVARGFIRYAEAGLSVEAYEYRDGVLVCVHAAEREHDRRSPNHALDFRGEHLSYREGQLVKIVCRWKRGGSETLNIAQKTATNRTTVLDLRGDAQKIAKYVRAQVAKHRKKRATAPVTRIDFGFGYGESSFVSLHLDTRPDAEPDGEWTKHIKESVLEMPQWSEAVEIWGNKPLRLILTDGTERYVAEEEDLDNEAFAALLGDMLKNVLLSARADALFVPLRKANRCELGVEELEGNHGWPAYEDRGKANLA